VFLHSFIFPKYLVLKDKPSFFLTPCLLYDGAWIELVEYYIIANHYILQASISMWSDYHGDTIILFLLYFWN
jgi:hypothetical protein